MLDDKVGMNVLPLAPDPEPLCLMTIAVVLAVDVPVGNLDAQMYGQTICNGLLRRISDEGLGVPRKELGDCSCERDP